MIRFQEYWNRLLRKKEDIILDALDGKKIKSEQTLYEYIDEHLVLVHMNHEANTLIRAISNYLEQREK